MLTKFLDSSNLEWDEMLPFACSATAYSLVAMYIESPFYLMLGWELPEGKLTHLNNCSRYYRDNNGKIISSEIHKL